MEDYKKDPKVQEDFHRFKVEQNIKRAKKDLKQAQLHNPNITVEDLVMIYHFQPLAYEKYVRGEVDLDYVPGGKDQSNFSLGQYIYGDKYKGVRRWDHKRRKYDYNK